MGYLKRIAMGLAMSFAASIGAVFTAVFAFVMLILFAAIFLLAPPSVKAAEIRDDGKSHFVRYTPVEGKGQELLPILLVLPRNGGDFADKGALHKGVVSNGWREEKNGDMFDVPGSCAVLIINSSRYYIECALEHGTELHIVQQEVGSARAVIFIIKSFSRIRMLPLPQSPERKKAPVKTILV